MPLENGTYASALMDQVRRAAVPDVSQSGSSDFDLNSDAPSKAAKYKPAAVLVPIVDGTDGLEVILTKRAAHLKHHPGQVAFPGGKVDPTDKDAQSAALREAYEEIGLLESQADVLGSLPPHKTVTGFVVQPFLATVTPDFVSRSDPGEVEEVFRVPLDHVLDPDNYFVEGRVWMGKERRYYVVPYGPYYIWGATARMLRMFADRFEQANAD